MNDIKKYHEVNNILPINKFNVTIREDLFEDRPDKRMQDFYFFKYLLYCYTFRNHFNVAGLFYKMRDLTRFV